MPLIYAGIDEAGYGPLLGPLSVCVAAIEVDRWDEGDPAPDLWEHLDRWVCRSPREAAGRVPVADSKKLKLSNQSKTRHPLTHLELGVLGWLGSVGITPRTDTELLSTLGASLEPHPWYTGDDTPLPLANDSGLTAIAASRLAQAESAGVRLLGIRCLAIGETRFNRAVRAEGSKAAVTSAAVAQLIRHALDITSADRSLRIVCDRQSGRSEYTDLLRKALPDAAVTCDARTPAASHYTLRVPQNDGVREVGVLFQTAAEDRHLPVALASMTAKLVRELAMARFNRYWCARCPELKPTAGYRQDGGRWLRDLGAELSPAERSTLIRLS